MATNNAVNTYIVPTTANEVTMPSQPAFLAYATTMTNVTGDSTWVNPVQIDNEIFDQNSDFNVGTYTFTAPLTGRYLFSSCFNIAQAATATGCYALLITSNRNYSIFDTNNTANIVNPSDALTVPRGNFADMDAADTACVAVLVSGMARTVDISGGSIPDTPTVFGGELLV